MVISHLELNGLSVLCFGNTAILILDVPCLDRLLDRGLHALRREQFVVLQSFSCLNMPAFQSVQLVYIDAPGDLFELISKHWVLLHLTSKSVFQIYDLVLLQLRDLVETELLFVLAFGSLSRVLGVIRWEDLFLWPYSSLVPIVSALPLYVSQLLTRCDRLSLGTFVFC